VYTTSGSLRLSSRLIIERVSSIIYDHHYRHHHHHHHNQHHHRARQTTNINRTRLPRSAPRVHETVLSATGRGRCSWPSGRNWFISVRVSTVTRTILFPDFAYTYYVLTTSSWNKYTLVWIYFNAKLLYQNIATEWQLWHKLLSPSVSGMFSSLTSVVATLRYTKLLCEIFTYLLTVCEHVSNERSLIRATRRRIQRWAVVLIVVRVQRPLEAFARQFYPNTYRQPMARVISPRFINA